MLCVCEDTIPTIASTWMYEVSGTLSQYALPPSNKMSHQLVCTCMCSNLIFDTCTSACEKSSSLSSQKLYLCELKAESRVFRWANMKLHIWRTLTCQAPYLLPFLFSHKNIISNVEHWEHLVMVLIQLSYYAMKFFVIFLAIFFAFLWVSFLYLLPISSSTWLSRARKSY